MRGLRTRIAALLAATLLTSLAAAGQTREASHYLIDSEHSALSWELPATLHTVHGVVPEFSGSVDLDPEVVFELDKVEGNWEKLAAGEPFDARVSGRLTIHGKTLSQEIPVSVTPASDA